MTNPLRFMAIAGVLVLTGAALEAQPSIASVTPASGSGGSQTFTLTATSSDWGGQGNVYLFFNWGLWSAGSCYVNYSQSTQLFYLNSDAIGWQPLTTGLSSVSSPQCTLNATNSTATLSGSSLSVTFSVTFNTSFIGPQSAYAIAFDASGLNSNWQNTGSWTAYAAPYTQPPTVSQASPASGTGMGQTFTFTATDLNGAAYMPFEWIFLGLYGNPGCTLVVYHVPTQFYLISDDGTVWTYVPPGGSASNSQCTIYSASGTNSGNNWITTVSVAFSASYAGASKPVYVQAFDNAGQYNPTILVGTWTVPSSPTDNAACSSMTVPSTVNAGAAIPFSVTMQNNGTANWTGESMNLSNFMYLGINPWDSGGAFGNMIWNHLPGTPQIVFPGQSVTFSNASASAPVVAPTTPGTYTFSWQMGHQGGPDWNFGAACSQQVTVPPPAAAPTFTPPGGIYTTTQSVTIASAQGATIRYTIDGTTPTETHGAIYGGPVSVSVALTLKAIAYGASWSDSAVTTATYYFSNPTGGTGTGGGAGSGTPPGDSGNGMDPRRVGVRAFGAYWGDAGENLDTTSGNLNFSNTMIKPFGRGNWTLPLMLSYNSQMWRKDSGGDWLMGQDVGYGMGWRLQMGSLTPVWSGTSTIDHYIFTDASGAEYNLSVNNGGVWTSTEGTYISYDSNANRIYNNDGSYWVMGCTSAGTEQDAGVMYPTLAENANGNQITIAYLPGQGMGTANTSARISSVTDTRGAYGFTYATVSPSDDIQHLTYIAGQPGESWALTYAGANLASPLSGAAFGATELLATLQQVNGSGTPPAATFSYNSAAEMTQYVAPMGGSISWGYAGNTYSGNVTLHEVTGRSMNQGAGSFTNSHTLSHPTTCDTAGGAYHACTQILDNGAGSKKIYYAAAQSSMVLPSEYQETDNNGSTLLLQKSFTWTQNPVSNSWYVGTVSTTLNPGGSNAATTSTVQTLDNYGNLTAQNVYDYGSSTVSRSYSLGYITDSNYTSRYMRNLLGQATVTANSVTTILVSYGYDGTGLGALQVPKDQAGFTVPMPQHDSAYDTTVTYRGNVTSAWKMGTSTSYAYDIGGNPYKAQDGDGMTISLATSSSTGGSLPALLTPNSNSNLATSMSYTSSYAPTSVTGANGATQSMTYDGFNRPASSTSVDGAVTGYAYGYGPNTQTATISTTTNGTTTTQWRVTAFDGFGRTIKVQTGHDGTTVNTVDTVYGACGCSPLGKVMKVSMPYGPGETEVWTNYTYDGSGRQLTSTVPDGSVTTTSYSGNSVTTTDPAGAWKTNVMDAFGNLTTVYEPDPVTGSPTTGPATYYAYNGASQLVSVYMLRSGIAQSRAFTYSGSDMLTDTTPEAGTVTYTYDNNHHVLARIDALNQKTAYTYDSYERLTMVQHYTWGYNPLCSGGCVLQWNEQANQDVSYYYDLPAGIDNYTQNYTWGRLSAVTFAAQTVDNQGPYFIYEYSYNQAGRVTGNRMLMAQGSDYFDLKGQYAWDNQGRMTQMTYPSGPVMNYQFDAMGRLGTVNEAGSSQALPVVAAYTSAGQLLSLQWGTNSRPFYETRTYNSMLQLTALSVGTAMGSGLNMQYNYTSGHNNGRVSQTIDSVLGETVNYSYDYLHRLTGATSTNGTWGEAYAYDGFGNLTSKTPTVGSAPAYTAGDNPSTNAPGPADANGNLTTANVNSTTQWDVENRLTASRPVGSADNYTYVYDPWGRRIWKQDSDSYQGTTTCEAYFYGATGQKLESYSCAWGSDGGFGATLQGINTYFGGKMLSEKGVYVATDRLGSVRKNSNGETFSYYPWGEERGQGTADGRTKFASYYRDMPGQDYAMARYYSGMAGSFWSPDPGGVKTADSKTPGTWNRYAYVAGDPVNAIDPRGTDLFLISQPGAQDCTNDPSQDGCNDPCQPNPYADGLLDSPAPECSAGPVNSGPTASVEPAQPDCNGILEADLANYLGSYKGGSSPLNNWGNIDDIVQAGMNYDVDPRLLVALSVAESQAGTHLTWGPYNAWNNLAYKPPSPSYTSWDQAITSVALLADKYISGNGLTSTSTFYRIYQGPGDKKGLRNLNIALKQMGGKTDQLTDPCNPANLRPPNQ